MLDHNDELIDRAIAAQKQGKFILASEIYLELLKINPRDPDANHNLGILNVQLNRFDEAILFLENAINSNAQVCQFWITLADTFIKMDRFVDAEQIIKQAIELGHQDTVFDQMLEHISKFGKEKNACDISYQNPSNKVLKKLEKLNNVKDKKKFLKLLKGQLSEFPNSPQLHEIAGHTFRSEGDFHKAESHFKFVFKSDPNRLASYINLAVVFLELEKFGEAIDCLNKGRLLFPDDYRIYYNLGVGYSGEGLYEEAVAFYLKALALNDLFFDAYINLANAYSELGRVDLSIETTEKILALKPERYEVYYNLGHYTKISGDLEKAKLAFTKALEINPRCASSHHGLATLTKYDTCSDHLRVLENLAASKSAEGDQELIHFSLAKAYEELGDYKKSFSHYLEANEIRNRENNYSHSHQARLLENIKENSKFLQSVPAFSQDEEGSPTPIFIIGMPRSGTTLVEQIVSSHSLIAPAGELSSVQLFNGLLAEEKVHISELQLNLFKKSYFRELEQYRDKEKYVTDKLPHNFMSVALILNIFPESPIIHVKRDPRAVCWSNFKHAFTKNSLKYSSCLKNIVEFYKGYEDLMNFWFEEYPNKIHTIDYENLVINPENETKKLISFIGIDWENACLQPHENKRSIKTASQSQVREKIYSGSSKAW